MKSLRDFLIATWRRIETFHNPGYVIRLQKKTTNTGKKEKFAQKKNCTNKVCTKMMSHIFIKTGSTRNKDPLRNRTVIENKCSSIDKGCDLSIEMLSYKLTKIRLANLKTPLSFF